MADTFTIERSAVIGAPAEVVFSFINDFHQWALWSPWDKMDTDLARTYSGAETGVGTHYGWAGKKSGAGTMDILRSEPATLIAIDLKFTKPFKAENDTRFTLTPDGGGTRVVWTMTGKNTLIGKVMGLFMSMDKMVGGSFEEGLASLKTISEARAAAAAS